MRYKFNNSTAFSVQGFVVIVWCRGGVEKYSLNGIKLIDW